LQPYDEARYTQAKRHAWGAIDLAYIVCQYYNNMDRVPFRKVGLYKLNAVDPALESARCQPLNL
jgi:hypothetical protein